MSSAITLTASMRSNLSSLKILSKQMGKTQERLATGKKVNSAIDNASSYYQARALTNRAADLNALLDSMGQGIQTIQAATTGLEKAADMLEQASVIASDAYQACKIPEKAYFLSRGADAVVSTAQELKDALAAGKETICVYGAIDLGEVSEGLTVGSGQKLVGVGYFGDFDSEIDKFSSISARSDEEISMINVSNGIISDLSLSYENNKNNTRGIGTIRCVSGVIELRNLDVDFQRNGTVINNTAAIIHKEENPEIIITFEGKNHINSNENYGIYTVGGGKITVNGQMYTKKGIYGLRNTEINLNGEIYCAEKLIIHSDSIMNINGTVFTESYWNVTNYQTFGGGILNIGNKAKINTPRINVAPNSGGGNNKIIISEGAKLQMEGESVEVTQNYSSDEAKTYGLSYISDITKDSEAWTLEIDFDSISTAPVQEKASAQYARTLSQYDTMIADSSYQGINLLTGADLTVTLNESRTHSYTVQGEDMRANALGLVAREWKTGEDVAQSLKEISAALGKIRDFQAALGNAYGIIQTRENFTDAMTDVLEIGADDLVLADMNEESANYLALQTRQQLAINSLSLAAQSAQSILKLF